MAFFDLISLVESIKAFIIENIYALYMFLFISLHAAAIAFVMERFFKFNKLISWLTAAIIFLWLMELFMIRRIYWLFLIPSIVWILAIILLFTALLSLYHRSRQQDKRTTFDYR